MPWNAKTYGGYTRDSQEAIENGLECVTLLLSLGWTTNSASAVWANIGFEGAYNPWRWESDVVLPVGDWRINDPNAGIIHGYGLPQFTIPSKYLYAPSAQSDPDYAPNYSNLSGQPHDGASQLRFIDGHADYIPTATYPLSFAEFKLSTQSPEYLASAWLYNYERPLTPSATVEVRKREARYWFDLWGGISPTERKKFKYWLYCRRRF